MSHSDRLERMESEASVLKSNTDKLCSFIASESFHELSHLHKTLLKGQFNAMTTYLAILKCRIELLTKE